LLISTVKCEWNFSLGIKGGSGTALQSAVDLATRLSGNGADREGEDEWRLRTRDGSSQAFRTSIPYGDPH
jgi:hypothetical protein